MTRHIASDLLIVLGFSGIVGGTYLFSPPGALIVGGLLSMAYGILLGRA